ncbi:MAG: hypothetical protein M3391_00845 [Actinomycetota bacterium]|nr:hypothetical protein [Actinomycetota bacterium]
MEQERSCPWLSGPRDASLQLPPAKWWFVLSRDVLAKDHRRRAVAAHRPAVRCHRTPTFTSPIAR